MRIGIILLHGRIWRKSYSSETIFWKNELGRFLKTGDNYELACNATFDVPTGSGMCVFMPRRAEKAQSGDLKRCKNYTPEPSWFLFIAATLFSALFPLLSWAYMRKWRQGREFAGVGGRGGRRVRGNAGLWSRGSKPFLSCTHTLQTLRLSNGGKPDRTLKGLTLCFSKNGDTFAAWKEKAYFDGKHTFLTNLLLVYPPYSLLLLTDFSFVVKGSYPAAYPSISTF